MTVDRIKRRLAAESLHAGITCMYVGISAIRRIGIGANKEGLTPKEQAYAVKLSDDIEDLAKKGIRFRERLEGRTRKQQSPRHMA